MNAEEARRVPEAIKIRIVCSLNCAKNKDKSANLIDLIKYPVEFL